MNAPALALRMREILDSPGFGSDNARKAALRRALHEAAAGLKKAEIEALIADLRKRFPDRVYESAANARRLERASREMETELAALRAEHDRLARRTRAQDALLQKLHQAVEALGAGGRAAQGTVGGSITAPPDPEQLGPFADSLCLLLAFAADQDATALTVEETLRSGPSSRTREESLPELLRQLSRGDLAGGGTPALEKKLRRLHLLPAALLAGAQQSWKSGTREVLEALDPKTIEEGIQSKVPGLREREAWKEIRRRYEEFWGQFDKNLAHYYRAKFERIYMEKMEEGS